MDPYEWFILGPTLLLGVLIPLSRSARWGTLALALTLCGAFLAVSTWLPWKTGVVVSVSPNDVPPAGMTMWRSARWTGVAYSWRGPLILALAIGVSVASWWIGARRRADSLVRATGVAAFVVAASLATLGAVALDRYSPRTSASMDERRFDGDRPAAGLIVAAIASVSCVALSVALLRKVSNERGRRRGGIADAVTLRDVFK